jgi:hypothetical protein
MDNLGGNLGSFDRIERTLGPERRSGVALRPFPHIRRLSCDSIRRALPSF